MHWLWRAAVAVAVGSFVLVWGGASYHGLMELLRQPFRLSYRLTNNFAVMLIWTGAIAASLAAWGIVSHKRPPRPTETYCRKCGYILRGITEPRCPECGERI